jgi:hypothetical protein
MNVLNRASDLQTATVQNLTDFLLADLNLGFTFAERAKAEWQNGDVQGFERNKLNAEKAINAVRRFVERLPSDEVREDILARCANLERTVAALPVSNPRPTKKKK